MAHTDRQWWCIQFFPDIDALNSKRQPSMTNYVYCRDEVDAGKAADAIHAPGHYYAINEIRDELVPVVLRGLAEATTEEVRDELVKRGWKVTSA